MILRTGLIWRLYVALILSRTAWALPKPQDVPGVADKPEDAGLAQTPTVVDTKLVKIFKYWSEWTAASYCVPQLGKPGGRVFCETYGTCNTIAESKTEVRHTWLESGSAGATGFVGVDYTTKSVVLSMRGSVSLNNWITDIKYWLTDCSETTGIPGAQCETGFFNFWQMSKEKGALTAMNKAIAENPGFAIVITGHSLGGAAAVIGAAELRKTHKNVTLYTYGQPRVGNMVLSKAVTAQKNNFRITHTSDIVPQLPWESIDGFLCPGCTPYYHISPEYHITAGLGNDPSKYKVLEGYANYSGNAANKFVPDIVAHIQYYQVNMYSCVYPIDPLVNLIGWSAGTKAVSNETLSDIVLDYDKEWKLHDLAENGASQEEIDGLTFDVPKNAQLPTKQIQWPVVTN